MEMGNEKKQRVAVGRGLIDLVFSWSVKDVLNNHMYKNQVKQIPKTFSSTTDYLKSFTVPLVEETHADLLSSMTTLSHSPCSQIQYVKRSKDFKLPKNFFYDMAIKSSPREDNGKAYEPENGDLIAITTSFRPKQAKDLERSFVIAYVMGVREDRTKFSVLASKPVFAEENGRRSERASFFAIYLVNMTTNVRIWHALTSDPKERNAKVIERVLQSKFNDEKKCSICKFEQISSDSNSDVEKRIGSSGLNESQKKAVLSCIGSRNCRHKSTVSLIWGPPGTGKTNTVGFLLQSLLRMKCRTLACAPTNVAVLELTERLVKRVAGEAGKYDAYGLGDVVLFGNGERMKIDDRDELYDVFLDHRMDVLRYCFVAQTGWRDSLLSMISLLEDPKKSHVFYVQGKAVKRLIGDDSDSDDDMDKNVINLGKQGGAGLFGEASEDEQRKKALKKVIIQTLKENKNKEKKKETNEREKSREGEKGDKDKIFEKKKATKKKKETEKGTEGEKCDMDMIFEEFVKKTFDCLVERLYFCMVNLCTHLPTSLLSLEVVETMFAADEALKSFQTLLRGVASKELKHVFGEGKVCGDRRFDKLRRARMKSILLLKLLPSTFPVPYPPYGDFDRKVMREFFLANACLIFCTVSSSAKLHKKSKVPLELVIIDEAAQLKECESIIPLQLPGIRHAVLIGDERQLPAMVKSKVSGEADFGRSLFERLSSLGHKKHLLNVQHRMHPSISLFPNREFYQNQISDGPNVVVQSYNKTFLPGNMFGPYSFINVTHGKESFDNSYSTKNLVEVAVVSEIVSSLYKEAKCSKKKIRVGVISPYKAQVFAITEKFGKTYSSDPQSDFSVSVRSVDGFQGGEEDVIIISTVRSNGRGAVGFLSNCQRANVALTRARHCLWIVGNGSTLSKSCSVWKKLVVDAKERRCFHEADMDKNLARAMVASLTKLKQIDVSPNLVSLLFRESLWKVCFEDAFWSSMARFKDSEFCKEVLSLIDKLSHGWRREKDEYNPAINVGKSSELAEHYKVRQRYLVWAVDTQRETSHHTQILKIWGVSESSDVATLSKQLDMIYKSYGPEKMSRCKCRYADGNLVVPMRWAVDSASDEADPLNLLSKSLTWLSLKDETEKYLISH